MNISLRSLFFPILLLGSLSVSAQKEAAIWYFGENAGVDFNSGTPVALTDGEINTTEGCATISDANGNLLFYTDGSTIWDQNHNITPNGLGLLGEMSSTQSAIIVPAPEMPNVYYVFTVHSAGQEPGLNYSIVDMTLNGGLGDIGAQKNIQLESRVSEKLTAVQHANGRDIWVLSHNFPGNEYLAYLVTPTGVNPTPVRTTIGAIHVTTGFSGYMKASPDGSKLASCVYIDGIVELYDFNNATGVISNLLTLDSVVQKDYYGVEFSPSGRFLYAVENTFPTESKLIQYDLDSPDIISSAIIVHDDMEQYVTRLNALQLGIDGKIYGVNSSKSYLSAIENPEGLGLACNFVERAVDLNGRTGQSGLPQFIQSFFLVNLEFNNLCSGSPTEFRVNSTKTIDAILWDFGDGNTSTMENPSHTYISPGTYTVNVTVTTGPDIKTDTRDITIYDTPVANTPDDLVGCVSSGSYNIDLASFDTTVLGNQNPNTFKVDYFLNQADADNNTNPLEPEHSFPYGTTPVYVRVSNTNNGQCHDTAQFNIMAREAPIVGTLTDWTVCDDDTDGLFTFDLAQKNAEIFNGQDETKFDILYFASQADADAGTNELHLNYTNTTATETIFVRFQNSTYPSCYRTGSFTIEVIPGVVAHTPNNLELCDDNNDGEAIFDLTQTETEIIGNQNPNGLNLSFHETHADAEAGLNSVNAKDYPSTSQQTTIYVRVENTTDMSCYDTTSFHLTIFDTPVAPTVTDWWVCDDNNDGQYLFDLTEKEAEILNGANAASVSFYASRTDAELSQNEIVGNYHNARNPQTIYFRLENTNNPQCFTVGSFQLQVFDTPTANVASDIILCDTDETGSYSFDLSQKDVEVLNGQDPLFYDVSYHKTEADAQYNLAPVSKADYHNINPNEILWARVAHAELESCFDLSSFGLRVNPLPQLDVAEQYVICPDSPDLVIDGGDFETWTWQDGTGAVISTGRTLDVLVLGEYQLRVTRTTNGITCENTRAFEVVSSGAPETLSVDLDGFSDEIELELLATGPGEFEYSVDGESFQASNRFTVFPGAYTVYVRDLYNCRTITEEVIALGYQRFFTPNGDGVHEQWNIIGGELYPESQLFIYDRYGKLLGQFPPGSNGWDGSFNGRDLPAADYWFQFVYDGNRSLNGHFSLKR